MPIVDAHPIRAMSRLPNPLGLLPLALLYSACAASPRTVELETPPVVIQAQPPTGDYLVYVVSESTDDIALIRFGPGGARVERTVRTGMMPTEINGPHGVDVAPDGEHYYVSVGHGTPFGTLWKYRTANDELVARTTLGHFPASLQVSPDNHWVYVANFNLHGDMVPSSISVVSAEDMLEVARIRTCTMPHGSRFSPAGTLHYSTCMMDDMLIEIDTRTLEVSRHFMLAAGREHGMSGAPGAMHAHAGHHGGHGADGAPTGAVHAEHVEQSCSPTWADVSPDGSRVYAACNRSDDIVVIDVASWSLVRRIPAGRGVYNLDITPDGRRLIATNKGGRSVSIFALPSGDRLAEIATQRPIVHGIAISPDSRYAFISVEGIGAEPGTVEVIDIAARRSVARVDVGQQAAGIAFSRMEPAALR